MCAESPRSKNDVKHIAKRLERDAAAAFSCLFVAMLVDVASKAFNFDLHTSTPSSEGVNHQGGTSDESLEAYAMDAVLMTPLLITQLCRFACVHSISGKELIFQVCCDDCNTI